MTAIAPKTIGADKIEYNHDVDVSPAYAAHFPLITDVLRNDTLVEAFKHEDGESRAYKRRFLTLGTIAVIVGVVPLLCAPFAVGIKGASWPELLLLCGMDAGGVVGISLIIFMRIKGYRDRWRRAVFVRERMRQWHFQLFLDGQFVQLASADPVKFREELARRWVEFTEGVRATHNDLQTFINDEFKNSDLYIAPTQYTRPDVAEQVWKALSLLRIRHQIGFAGIKLDSTDSGYFLPAVKKREFVEATAAVSLLAAICITVAFFCVDIVMAVYRAWGWSVAELQSIPLLLFQCAMSFAALSAGVRALRTGLTLSEEIESYDHYRAEVVQLGRLFDSAASAGKKLDVLAQLEREASRELRRFLQMKARATFIL